MTMLELLELQARARAIRSQLALEPVQKIELSDEENQEENETINENISAEVSTEQATTSQEQSSIEIFDKPPEKSKATIDIEEDALVVKLPAAPPGPPSKPLKIKRNYRGQLVIPEKPAPQHKDDDEESDSSDIITIDPNMETYFISDSEEEDAEPPAKKTSPEKLIEETKAITIENVEIIQGPDPEPEEGEVISASNSPKNLSETVEAEAPVEEENVAVEEAVVDQELSHKEIISPQTPAENVDDDDDIVNLTSDTEIEIDQPVVEEKIEETQEKVDEEEKQDSPLQIDYDDSDVVDIHAGGAEEAVFMDESDKETTSKKSDSDNQTWEDRWLSSSKTQKVLKTTKIASKVRVNVLRTRKSERETAKKLELQKKEEEKEFREKIQNAEEGSMDQFKKLKGD